MKTAPQGVRPKRLKERRLKRYVKSVALLFAAAIVFVLALAAMSHVPWFAFDGIEVISPDADLSLRVRTAIDKDLATPRYKIFDRHNIFLLNREGLADRIAAQFPNTENYSVMLQGLRHVAVKLDTRKASALWCISIGENAPCYFIDTTGYVFAPAPNFSSTAFFKYVDGDAASTTVENTDSPIGRLFIPQEEFASLTILSQSLEKMKLEPVELRIYAERYEVVLEGETKEEMGARIIIAKDENLNRSLEKIETILAGSDLKNKLTASGALSGVDYIDARFGNKVYYK